MGRGGRRRRIINGTMVVFLALLMLVGPENVQALHHEHLLYQALGPAALGATADVQTTYEYDAAGNMIKETRGGISNEYVYDAENHLRQAVIQIDVGQTKTISYTYDADGIRTSKTLQVGSGDPTTTYYLVDKNRDYAQVLAEFTATDPADPSQDVPQVTYRYGLDLISQTRDPEGPTPITRYFHYDGQLSTRHLTNAAGAETDSYTYGAYGELLSQTQPGGGPATPNSYLYTGEQLDPDLGAANTPGGGAGFYYLRARYYSPGQGRFTGRDPIEALSESPITLHRYLYANANPAHYIDPTGCFSIVRIAVVCSLTLFLGTLLLTAIPAAWNSVFHGSRFFHGWVRNMDDFAAYLPWFIYDSDDYVLPSTPGGVIRAHKKDFAAMEAKYGVPKVLLATVLLTELRHYNAFDTVTDYSRNASVGIAQIRPDTILNHATSRPELYPRNLTTESVYELLKQPNSAIDLLAREIKYQAVMHNIQLSRWATGDDQVRRRMVIGFTSAKDTDDYYNVTNFGTIWGIESYEMIRKDRLLD